MLRLENVKKHYDGFDLDFSMEVKRGFVTGLIGKNGAGKSTTFKLILGLVGREGGHVEIFQKPVEQVGPKEKERLGVVLSDSGFNGVFTIQDLVPVLKNLYPRFKEETFLQKCRDFDLPIHKKLKEFSTGMKQKLQVFTAISHEAELLILDEPTAGMDVIAREEILDLLREYVESGERSILISSHISGDLENFCDDIYMIDKGKIILHEDTDILLDNYALLKVTEEQYRKLDKTYILRRKKEAFGYSCLTNQKQFYQENAPQIALEKGSIDEVILMMIKGEEK